MPHRLSSRAYSIIIFFLAAAAALWVAFHEQKTLVRDVPSVPAASLLNGGTVTTPTAATPTMAPAKTDVITYENGPLGFKITYPKDAETAKPGDFAGYLPATRQAIISIYLPATLSAGTNLGEAAVFVGVSDKPENLSSCLQALEGDEQDQGTAYLGGTAFRYFTGLGVAAGNTYQSKYYRLVQAGRCYEVVTLLHWGNIDNYPPGTVKEFDQPKFQKMLDAIAQSFALTFKQP